MYKMLNLNNRLTNNQNDDAKELLVKKELSQSDILERKNDGGGTLLQKGLKGLPERRRGRILQKFDNNHGRLIK